MAAPVDPGTFKEAFIVLASASIVIPLVQRLKLSPVLGFILIGVLVGPAGLGALVDRFPWLGAVTITDPEAIQTVAEFGVVMLLFMIGLELSLRRLRVMARLVFGLGGLQLMLTTPALGLIAYGFGASPGEAAVIGLALSLSSTAVIVQVLSEEKRLTQPVGRASFAMLLFQDIAVVPILIGIALLGRQSEALAYGPFLWTLAKAIIAALAIVALGQVLLRPLFRWVAAARSPELFLAACLLVILSTSLAAAAAGLSMAMGALAAGVLLAETEFRRQVEILIDPFKGLLLGVFLISVGMSLNVPGMVAHPLLTLGAGLGLILTKGAIVYLSMRLFGFKPVPALQAGLLMGPGSEFSFVILAAAGAAGLTAGPSTFALTIAALTMALIPFLSQLGRTIAPRMAPRAQPDATLELPSGYEGSPRVIVAGYGRVGRLVGDMLAHHGVPYVAIDTDTKAAARGRHEGRPVYFGDITHPAMLARLDLDQARALVVTLDAPRAAEALVSAARKARPDLLIVCRSRDAHHAARLYALGASDVAPEASEASLQLSEAVLVDLGIAMGPVIASIHEKRAAMRAEIRSMAPHALVPDRPRRRLRELAAAKGASDKAAP